MEDMYERFENPKGEENCDGEDEKMEVEEERPAGFMERSFLKKACKVSKESRYCLMCSCIYAYNLTDKIQKPMFKENLGYLQSSVQKLSEFLEKDVHKLSDDEKSREMEGIVDFCDSRRKNILEYIKEHQFKNI